MQTRTRGANPCSCLRGRASHNVRVRCEFVNVQGYRDVEWWRSGGELASRDGFRHPATGGPMRSYLVLLMTAAAATTAAATPASAKGVFLNGVNIDGVVNQKF